MIAAKEAVVEAVAMVEVMVATMVAKEGMTMVNIKTIIMMVGPVPMVVAIAM